MQFKLEGKDPRTGKDRKLSRIPPKETTISENFFCNLCGDTGIVEEHQFCSCEKGQSLRRSELNLPKPKISTPPPPFDDQKSAFDQPRPDQGTQLDLFGN